MTKILSALGPRVCLLLSTLTVAVFAGTPATSAAPGTPAMPASAAAPAATSPAVVLALGDSLTEGYGLGKSAAWPTLVEADLKQQGYAVTIVNAGVSGSTSASALSRLKWQLNAKPKPTILVLALGANDGLRGLSVDDTKKNLSAAISLAKESGLTVLLAGMKLPPSLGAEYVGKFEAMFPALAKEHGIALIPFLLDGVAADPKLNLADGIHPNAEGYKIVAKTVLVHLKPLIPR